MGINIKSLYSYYEYNTEDPMPEIPRQVFSLAQEAVNQVIESGLPENLTHIVVATTCPDSLAPSMGQMIIEYYHKQFSHCHCFDLVQGCAGGVSAMILGSQLAALHQSAVLVIQTDAAQKATSKQKDIHSIFGNGAFTCIIKYEDTNRRLIHTQSRQYKGLSEVVTVKLGHDADEIIKANPEAIISDPRFYLGLNMNNQLALQLIKNAEQFYKDFIAISGHPDVMILHQVNPLILQHLKSVFEKYNLAFIDVSSQTGNCGAASVGIALSINYEKVINKKVMLCSFGTGGVITAGLWQF